MIVAGLDLSLGASGIVIAEASPEAFRVLRAGVIRPDKNMRGIERVQWVMSNIRREIRTHAVQDIAIEGYAFSKLTTHAHAQGELGGVVRLALWQRGFSWWEVPPATLKKFVAGKGNAPKELMLREVYRRWQYVAPDNDVADAYSLARAVAAHYHGHERKTDAEAWKAATRVTGRVLAAAAESGASGAAA